MLVNSWYRYLPIPIALICYLSAWWALGAGLPADLAREHAGQILLTILIMAASALPALLLPALYAGLIVVLQAVGVLYLSFAMGPHLVGLCLAVLPTLMVCGLRFSLPAGSALAVLPISALSVLLLPHQVWEIDNPAAKGLEFAALMALLLVFFVQAVFIRLLVLASERQRQDISRLDFAFQNIAQANLEFQTQALFARQEAVDQERRRVAGEIHDIIGYTLTNLIILIQTALALSPPGEKVHGIMESAASQATDGLANARRSLTLLRSRTSDRPKGANLFLQLTRQFSAATGVRVQINFGNLPRDLPVEVERALFRVIQEGLTNSFRHGNARLVDLGFWYDGRRLTLKLVDDGLGSAAAKNGREGGGIGLSGLAELIKGLGGSFSSGPVEGGFALRTMLPLSPEGRDYD
jgi:signal transduction histidine kinase